MSVRVTGGGELTGVAMRAMTLVLAGVLSLALAPPTPVTGAETKIRSQVVPSFDGTPLYSTLFLPASVSGSRPAPLVLRSHGWGAHGEREVVSGSTLEQLLEAGYAVLTWDARGFGYSGGVAHLDQPAFEGRDVSALLD
ncbi:MAG: ABC transporter, partial [Actinomycetota bacterium]|nr:ABC transporter [Actinomycetota bacterium]